MIVTPPSSRFCPWSRLRPPHYAVRGSGEPNTATPFHHLSETTTSIARSGQGPLWRLDKQVKIKQFSKTRPQPRGEFTTSGCEDFPPPPVEFL
jgi:hypothetical protein